MLTLSQAEAAPPFAIFERWAPRTRISNAFRDVAVHRWQWKNGCVGEAPDAIVRGTHPSKIAKGGAASVINGADKNQRWASPPTDELKRVRYIEVRTDVSVDYLLPLNDVTP